MTLRIVVGADNAAFAHKEALKQDLQSDDRVSEVIDVGITNSEDGEIYPNIAVAAAEKIAAGEADRGLLMCGTGLGVAIAANKVKGIRAATADDLYSVQRSVLSNNAQVLCMGGRVIGIEAARALLPIWLDLEFDPSSPSAEKVDAICAYEED